MIRYLLLTMICRTLGVRQPHAVVLFRPWGIVKLGLLAVLLFYIMTLLHAAMRAL